MKTLSEYLAGVSAVDGVPVVRTLAEQMKTPLPHIVAYTDGRVKIFVRPTESRDWDPSRPLRSQLL